VTSLFYKGTTEKKEIINFTQIDQYPLFKNCDTLVNYDAGKLCFEKNIYTILKDRVGSLQLKSDKSITDTLFIKFTIDKEGSFICNEIECKDTTELELPNITVEIKKIIVGLCPVQPAQKRGIPIVSNYTIPLVIKTQ